jgi:hypothetical protein
MGSTNAMASTNWAAVTPAHDQCAYTFAGGAFAVLSPQRRNQQHETGPTRLQFVEPV